VGATYQVTEARKELLSDNLS